MSNKTSQQRIDNSYNKQLRQDKGTVVDTNAQTKIVAVEIQNISPAIMSSLQRSRSLVFRLLLEALGTLAETSASF